MLNEVEEKNFDDNWNAPDTEVQNSFEMQRNALARR
jgi:hypothetical protein